MSAVEQFNDLFGFNFSEPAEAHYLQVMAGYARDRGRADVAERLLKEDHGTTDHGTTRCLSVEEHNAFPGGRW